MSRRTNSAGNDAFPVIALKPGADRRLSRGHPWLYSNEIEMTAEAKGLAPGGLVRIEAKGADAGIAMFNPHTLIAARILARDSGEDVNGVFLAERIAAAQALRDRLFDRPFYRLVHAEGDGLPGLVIDRYGDVFVVQANTAGMDRLTPLILEALDAQFAPKAIVLRNDSPARDLEGLERTVELAKGTLDGPVEGEENGAAFLADPMGGQKTGWFFDHRLNRAFASGFAAGARVLDLYSHTGGFGLQCAVSGAAHVTCIDRSAPALALAEQAAKRNDVAERLEVRKADVFAALEHLIRAGEQFDLVIADPPAFVKSRKDLKAGIRGYRKLARLAGGVIAPGGILVAASCSHLVDLDAFRSQTVRGLAEADRQGRILHTGGAGPDHPAHLHLPETAYLKALVMALD